MPKALLLDLDGTLADTAPDLAAARPGDSPASAIHPPRRFSFLDDSPTSDFPPPRRLGQPPGGGAGLRGGRALHPGGDQGCAFIPIACDLFDGLFGRFSRLSV